MPGAGPKIPAPANVTAPLAPAPQNDFEKCSEELGRNNNNVKMLVSSNFKI
jgi:hypothetical protein